MKSSNALVWVTNLNKITEQVCPAFFDGDIYVTSLFFFQPYNRVIKENYQKGEVSNLKRTT